MNVLNLPTAAHLSASQLAQAANPSPASIFPKGSVFTLIGQVHDLKPGWSGRIGCTLRLSVGDLALRANRGTLPMDIVNGTWIRAKLIQQHEQDDKGGPALHVLSAIATVPAPGETCWIPVTLHHRLAGMQALRRLLSALEPGLQGLFTCLMLDAKVQRQFFWRVAASDHGCYPGGLFDQSLGAASLAHQSEYANERDRGLATTASLLWDIGKVSDAVLREDRTRTWPELQPHASTALRMKRPLACLALSQPALALDLGALLATGNETPIAPLTNRTAFLRRQVHRAVHESWGPAESFLNTITPPGAEA